MSCICINYNPPDSHVTVRWNENELFQSCGIFIHFFKASDQVIWPVSLTMSDCSCNIWPDLMFSAPFVPHYLISCQNLQHWSHHSTAFHTFFKIFAIYQSMIIYILRSWLYQQPCALNHNMLGSSEYHIFISSVQNFKQTHRFFSFICNKAVGCLSIGSSLAASFSAKCSYRYI